MDEHHRLIIRNLNIAVACVFGTLTLGTIGNRFILGNDWIVAFENSALLSVGVGFSSDSQFKKGTVRQRLWISIFSIFAWFLFALVVALIVQILINPLVTE